MILKDFFSKNQSFLKEVVVKKILNKSIYEKSYVRGPLMDSKTIQLLDNNTSFYNLSSQNISKIYNNCLYMDDAIDTTIKLFMNDNTFSGLVIYPPLVIQNYYCKTTITRNFKINKNKLLTLIIKKNVS